MDFYDPLIPPDPAEWLAMDETDRIELARDYHERANIQTFGLEEHAAFHAIVENQIAMADETPVAAAIVENQIAMADETPVAAAIAGFMSQGLNLVDAHGPKRRVITVLNSEADTVKSPAAVLRRLPPRDRPTYPQG